MDYHTMDTALQRSIVRKPERRIYPSGKRRRDVILAHALADKVLGEGEYTVLETITGKSLEYKEYEPLFRYVSPKENAGMSPVTIT